MELVQVYTWGQGSMGQLGHQETQKSMTPKIVSALSDRNIYARNISCGLFHNAILTVDGDVYTWGSNLHNALGRPGSTHRGKGRNTRS